MACPLPPREPSSARLRGLVMSQENQPQNLSGLEMDLLKSFQPSWVKESSSPQKISRFSEDGPGSRQDDRFSGGGDDSDFRHHRKPPKTQRLQRPHGSDNRHKPQRSSGDRPQGFAGKNRRSARTVRQLVAKIVNPPSQSGAFLSSKAGKSNFIPSRVASRD